MCGGAATPFGSNHASSTPRRRRRPRVRTTEDASDGAAKPSRPAMSRACASVAHARVRAAGPSTSRRASTSTSTASRPPPRARSGARVRVRAQALPPANEIAGFVVGGALLALCLAGTRLDAIIARAQARGFEEGDDERGAGARARTVEAKKPMRGSGNIFILPDDEDEDEARAS